MQSGVLTEESFSELLREVSQRRRQGVLEVLSRYGKIELFFVQGRIVDSRSSEGTPIHETLAWLKRAGYKIGEPAEYVEKTYEELFQTLRKAVPDCESNILKHIISERVLETICHLNLTEKAMYSFHVQMVEIEKDFSANLSVGQILLDFVELHEVTSSFIAVTKEATTLALVGKVPTDVNSFEKKVVEAINKSSNIDEIKSKTLLCEFHFMKTVNDLITQGIIVAKTESSNYSSKSVQVDDFVSSSIDKAFSGTDAPKQEKTKKHLTTPEKLHRFNSALLKSEEVPAFIALVIFFAAFLVPYITWGNVFRFFGE